MTAATYTRPNYTAQSGSAYPANIDGMARVFERIAAAFAPHEQDVGSPAPDMSLRVDAGYLHVGVTLSEIAAQTVSGFTVPASGYQRIDRVVVDALTGVASRVAGTAQTSGSPGPSAPAIPNGKLPVCQVLLTDSSTAITNSMITDERLPIPFLPAGDLIKAQSASSSSSIDFTTGIDAAYSSYLLLISDLVTATDNVSIDLRVTENGSAWEADASDYRWKSVDAYDNGAGTATGESTGTSQIRITGASSVGNDAAGESFSAAVRFFNPSGSARRKRFLFDCAFQNNSGTGYRTSGMGAYQGSNNPITGVRIFCSSGNISSGTFVLIGIRGG